MKKVFQAVLLIALFSCTKTEVKPSTSVSESNGILLAGAKGSSKTWQLASATGSLNNGTAQSITFNDCLTDNVFKFSNDDNQSLEHTEGLTKCTSTDSTLVEKGSWAFTADGKKLILDVIPYSNQYLFYLSLGTPALISDLSETNFKYSFDIVDGTDTYHYTLTFKKK